MRAIKRILEVGLEARLNAYLPVLIQFFRFAAVGAIGTLVHYFVLFLLVEYAASNVVTASSVGFVFGAFTNYFLNYHFTFGSQKQHTEALPKFLFVAFLGLPINSGIVAFYTTVVPIYYLLAQLLATGVVLLWNFAVNRLWTFR